MKTEYYRWTSRELDSLILGQGLSAVCTEEQHGRCIKKGRGCTSVLKREYIGFEGNTREERRANRERIAKEAQDKCRKVTIIIEETEKGV